MPTSRSCSGYRGWRGGGSGSSSSTRAARPSRRVPVLAVALLPQAVAAGGVATAEGPVQAAVRQRVDLLPEEPRVEHRVSRRGAAGARVLHRREWTRPPALS